MRIIFKFIYLLNLVLLLIFLNSAINLKAQTKQVIDKSIEQSLIKDFNFETLSFDSLYNLGNKYRLDNQFNIAKTLGNKALQLGKKKANNLEISRAYVLLSKIEHNSNKYKAADSLLMVSLKFAPVSFYQELYLQRASVAYRLRDEKMAVYLDRAQKYKQIHNPDLELKYLNLRLLLNHTLGNIAEAIDNGNELKILAQKHKDTTYLSMANANLGLLYGGLRLYDTATKLSLESYDLTVTTNDQWGQIFALISLANLHLDIENYLEVKKYCWEAIKIKEETGLSPSFDHLYFYLGKAYEQESKLDSAQYYYEKGILLRQDQGQDDSSLQLSLSHLYVKQNKISAAKKIAESTSVDSLSNASNQEWHEIMAKIAIKENNPAKALVHFDTSLKLLKDIQKDSLQRKLIAQLLQKEIEQKKKVEILELKETLTKQKQRLIYALLACLVLVVIVSGLTWLFKQNKLKESLLLKDLESQQLIAKQSLRINNINKAKNEELLKINHLKEKLFVNIAHELRTPLSLILNPLKNLGELDEKKSKRVQRAIRAGENLNSMVNQILELSKVNLGNSKAKVNEFSLKDLLNYVYYKFEDLVVYKEIDFQVNSPVEAVQLLTDAKKIETVLSNLVSNALKYTPSHRSIRIDAIVLRENIQFCIQDTGIGISQENLSKIFSEYYQIDQGEIIPEGGIGIGLAICREYINLLGGHIEVKSELNKGSTFTFIIPKELPVSSDTPITNFEFPLPETATYISKQHEDYPKTIKIEEEGTPSILIVEDNLDMCKYLQEILEQEYNLTFAHNGDSALKKIAKISPQLIITDLMMPVMDGMTLINKIRGQENLKDLPILVLTAKDSVMEELKSFRLGVDDFMIKPFEELELKTHIYHLLEDLDKEDRELYQEDSKIITSIDNNLMNEQDKKFLETLENHIDTLSKNHDLDVGQLAKEMYMSKANLTRKMKKLTGLTPKKYVNEIRLLKARRLILENSLLTVKYVSIQVGFRDEKLFARNFKARFGKYPSDYIRDTSANNMLS